MEASVAAGRRTGRAGRAAARPLAWARRVFGPHPEEDALFAQVGEPNTFVVGARLLAIAITIAAVVGSLLFDDGDDRYNIALVVVTGLPWALELAGVTLHRVLFAAWVLAPTLTLSVLGWSTHVAHWEAPSPAFSFGAQFSMFLMLLMIAEFMTAPRLHTLAVTSAALAVMVLRFVGEGDSFNLLIWTAAVGFLAVAGVAIRVSLLAIVTARDARAAQDASEQRRRIARDVHDVVAHTLAVTMLHMTAARMAVQRRALDDATEALEEAERHGRSSLADIRRIIRVLRDEDASALDAAQPDLADIGTLVERYRAAGLAVELAADGTTADAAGGQVLASTGLAAYRVVQEALANAARHGSGAATVTLRVHDGEVVLEVRNATPRRAAPDGHGTGLVGMRERVLAAGGSIEAGPVDGAWVVRAVLPVDGQVTPSLPAAPPGCPRTPGLRLTPAPQPQTRPATDDLAADAAAGDAAARTARTARTAGDAVAGTEAGTGTGTE